MTDRFFVLLHGKAHLGKNYYNLRNYQGNDFIGYCIRDGRIIYFKGLIEEIWAKYGKKVHFFLKNNKFYIDKTNKSKYFYFNKDGYFDNINEIKFNVLAHSSGDIALRMYFKVFREKIKYIII